MTLNHASALSGRKTSPQVKNTALVVEIDGLTSVLHKVVHGSHCFRHFPLV